MGVGREGCGDEEGRGGGGGGGEGRKSYQYNGKLT